MSFKFFGRQSVRKESIRNVKEDRRFDKGDTKKPIVAFNSKEFSENQKKNSLLQKILRSWADDESILRLSWTTVLVIILSLIAAGMFYGIEHNSKCEWDYWRSLWFVNTLFTTIGYGNLAPCTPGGRAVAVIVAIVGIPINVVALADVGKLMARFLNFIWLAIKCRIKSLRKCSKFGKHKVEQLTNNTSQSGDKNNVVPLSFALAIAVLWFLISALYFTITEPDNMDFGSSLYFILISVSTIGLGDVAPKNYNLVIVQFFFIVIGIALFSMVINIIQDKVDNLNDQIEVLISNEYAKAQQDGVRLEGSDEKAARNHVKNIIKNQKGGGLIRLAMGKHMEDRLVQDYMEKAKKCVTGCQTEKNMFHKEITAVPETVDVSIGVGIFDLCPDLVVTKKKKWPADGKIRGNQFEWLDLMHTSVKIRKRK